MKGNFSRKGNVWIAMGLLFIAAGFLLASYNLCDVMRAERSSEDVCLRLEARLPSEASRKSEAPEETSLLETAPLPEYVLCPDMEMPVETVNGADYIGILQIPCLELELPVISQWSYKGLKTAPCRYSGSAYQKDLILCAHNYVTHFGNLGKLREGDTATFTDIAGNVFTYQMVERETLSPTDTEDMKRGAWDMTLFTCTMGGKTRVTVRFQQVENHPL